MAIFSDDLFYAARGLKQRPVFAATLVLVLGLGVAANTCIFSVVNALVLNPMGFPGSDRLVDVRAISPERGWEGMAVSYPDFVDFKGQSGSFADLALYLPAEHNLTGADEPERIAGKRVSANFFGVLGVKPVLGRFFSPGEQGAGAPRAVILGEDLWRRRFGSDPGLIGRKVLLDENAHEVIGIAPRSLRFSSRDDVWLPLDFDLAREGRVARRLFCVGRLAPGVSIERAGREIAAIAERLERAYPESNKDFGAAVQPLYAAIYGESFARSWTLAWIAVFILLLIACVNATNLLLSRAAVRERELALRSALGAGRRLLIQHSLAESVLFAALGCVIAVLLSSWGIGLTTALLPKGVPRVEEVRLDAEAYGFTVLLSVLVALLCSLPPALHAARPDLVRSLKESGRGGTGGAGRRFRAALIVTEIALAATLLVAAALMIQSVLNLKHTERGFRTENRFAVRLTVPEAKYPKREQLVGFFGQVLRELRSLPGVRSVGAINELPTGQYPNWVQAFTVEGEIPPEPGAEPVADVRVVTADYFRTLGLPLLRGRDFRDGDKGEPRVAAISESLARQHFPGREPLGRRLLVQGISFEIVAVVGDVRQSGPREPMRQAIYYPFTQTRWYTMSCVLLTAADPASLASDVRAAIARVAPEQPIYSLQSLEDAMTEDIAQEQALARLLGLFVVAALILTTAGLYGVISYTVEQRFREMGIRLALGAGRESILGMVLRQGLVLVVLGLAFGLAGALVIPQVFSRLLFEIDARDPRVFAIVSALLMAISLLASYLPARRAASIDPAVTLKYE